MSKPVLYSAFVTGGIYPGRTTVVRELVLGRIDQYSTIKLQDIRVLKIVSCVSTVQRTLTCSPNSVTTSSRQTTRFRVKCAVQVPLQRASHAQWSQQEQAHLHASIQVHPHRRTGLRRSLDSVNFDSGRGRLWKFMCAREDGRNGKHESACLRFKSLFATL